MLMYRLLVDMRTYVHSKVSMDSRVMMDIMEPLDTTVGEGTSFDRKVFSNRKVSVSKSSLETIVENIDILESIGCHENKM